MDPNVASYSGVKIIYFRVVSNESVSSSPFLVAIIGLRGQEQCQGHAHNKQGRTEVSGGEQGGADPRLRALSRGSKGYTKGTAENGGDLYN